MSNYDIKRKFRREHYGTLVIHKPEAVFDGTTVTEDHCELQM
jgi:hypothetical protein